MKIWIVTHANEHGEGPKFPCPYVTEEAANAHLEEVMLEEWTNYGPEDDASGERMPYPGDWRTAQAAILDGFSDGSWAPFEITAHDVDFGPVVQNARTLLATVKRAINDWSDWDNDEGVNGGDMVEWYGIWRETAKAVVAKAEGRV